MNKEFTVIIPARFGSTRLPGKPLLKIGNKAMIEYVVLKALQSNAKRVIVATDDDRIKRHLENRITDNDSQIDKQCQVVMTSKDCASGTLRLAETIDKLDLNNDEIIVNIQGDEPFISVEAIDLVAQTLIDNQAQAKMATLKEKLDDFDSYHNHNVVKVISNKNDYAIYFSRSLIPNLSRVGDQKDIDIYKHLGIYAYSVAYIKEYANMPSCELEQIESLEQLRAIYNGDKIAIKAIKMPFSIGIDTPDDLLKAQQIINNEANL